MYLEVGKRYSRILTDIMVGRGINGIDFIALDNALILSIDGNDVVEIASMRKGEFFYRLSYVEKSHIVQAEPFSPKGDYWVQDSNKSSCKYVVEMTEAEYELNKQLGIQVYPKNQ